MYTSIVMGIWESMTHEREGVINARKVHLSKVAITQRRNEYILGDMVVSDRCDS